MTAAISLAKSALAILGGAVLKFLLLLGNEIPPPRPEGEKPLLRTSGP